MTVVECDREAQYLLLLLKTTNILKLTGSDTIIMQDYEFNDGKRNH